MKPTMSRLTLTLLSAALVSVLAFAGAAAKQDPARRFQEAIDRMETKGDYAGAIQIFESLLKNPDRTLAARALYYLGFCHEKLGNDRARRAYEQLIQEFSDQEKLVLMARSRLAAMQQTETDSGSGGLILRNVWKTQFNDPLGNPSPDGRYILCYVGDGDIGLHDLTTGQTRPLTKGASWDRPFAMNPVFSPGGRQIAYAWYNRDGSADLWAINVDGSGNRIIRKSENGRALLPDDWSRDGRQILVYSVRFGKTSETRPEIAAVALENGQMKTIKQEAGLGKAAYSPDGKYIVFESVRDGDRNIYLMSANGGMELPLVTDSGEDNLLGWTPNGKNILFSSNRRGGWEIWAIPVEGGRSKGTPVLIKEDVGMIAALGFTQDGSYFFKKGRWEFDIYEAGLDLVKRELIGSQRPAVYQYMGNNLSPGWSKEGTQFAYVRFHSAMRDQASLCIRNEISGKLQEFPLNLRTPHELYWAPDGRKLAVYGRDQENRRGHFSVDTQSGDIKPIFLWESVPDMQSISFCDWSPDGRSVFYLGIKTDGSNEIRKREIDTNKEDRIYQAAQNSFQIKNPVLAPDGKRLAFQLLQDGGSLQSLMVMTIGGKEADEILRRKAPVQFGGLLWTPDGRSLIFTQKRDAKLQATSELWIMGLQEKVPNQVGILDKCTEAFENLRIHPDAQKIVCTCSDKRQEVWVLRNFLPEEGAPGKEKQR